VIGALLLLAALGGAAEPSAAWVPIADGASAWVEHLPGDGPVVVLCHGISSNHRFWDLDEAHSFARWLQARGYDVWNMDLRGHGPARRDEAGHRQRAGWTIDDYGQGDLPAVFAYVRAETGAAKLNFVAHSLGGMAFAAYLAQEPEPPIASAVIVASPLDFRDPDRVTGLALRGARVASVAPFVPTPLGGRVAARLQHLPLRLDERLSAPGRMTPTSRRAMYRTVVSPMSSGELRQLGLAARAGDFTSADGAVTYREALGQVQVPMLFLAGRADHVASPDRVWGYFDAVGSPDKRFAVIGEAEGASGDYGHIDFALAEHAAADVFPLITAWIQEHP